MSADLASISNDFTLIEPNPTEAVEFLTELSRDRVHGYISLYTHIDEGSQRSPKHLATNLPVEPWETRVMSKYLKNSRQNGRGVFVATLTTPEDGTRCSSVTIDPLAIVADYDHGAAAPTDERLSQLGLPSPTVRVISGGGDHLWWFLTENSCTKEQRKAIVVAIAQATGGDESMKDNSRYLRLPGSVHLKDPSQPKLVIISEANYDRRYRAVDFDKFLTSTTVKDETPGARSIHTRTIPIDRLLTTEHRANLQGANKGSRNTIGAGLARDTIGVANLETIECDYHDRNYELSIVGNPKEIMENFCNGCIPPLAIEEGLEILEKAYQSADGKPCISDPESLKNCARAYLKEISTKIDKPNPTQQEVPNGSRDYRKLGIDLGMQLPNQAFDDGVPTSKLTKLKLDLYAALGDRLKYNQMSREIEFDGKAIDLNNAKMFVADTIWYDASTENCIAALDSLAKRNEYHPVRQYLESVRSVPTCPDLIEKFPMHFFGNDDPLQNVMFYRKLIGCVARVMKPGVKDDTLLILQGGQGVGKSTALRALAGDGWFSDDLRSIDDKDELAKLSRFWIHELAEVDYLFGKKEVEQFKRFLSGREDTFRPPYGRTNITVDRTCGLFASTNKTGILNDPTGDRRYWVVEVKTKVDIDNIKEHRDIIWATTLAAYERGELHFLTDTEQAEHTEANSQWRDDSDPWIEKIVKDLETTKMLNRDDFELIATETIMNQILNLDLIHQTKANSNRVATVMRGIGFELRQMRIDGKRPKLWARSIPTD
jgi:predicted P-loop ATPase